MATKQAIQAMAFCAAALLALGAVAETISIAATVNDDVITSVDLAERRALVMSNAQIPDTPENRQRITPRIMQSLIEESLELQEAKRTGVKVTDEEIAKAVDGLGAPQAPAGAVRARIQANGLSVRSLTDQVHAQLAWNKVVRKLRRSVTITQDEVERAQKLQSADPGTEETRLAVLAIAAPADDKQSEVISKEVQAELATGRDLPAVAEKYRSRPNVQYNPMLWVTEERTPPELYALIKQKKPGDLIGPFRSGPVIQFVKVLERRITKKAPPSTEVLVKQITLDAPSKSDKIQVAKLAESERLLRSNPGNCDDTTLPATPVPAAAAYARAKLGSLSPEQQNVVSRLEVGGVSESQLSGNKMIMVMLCERSESQGAPGIDDELRQKLFNEKMELESQKRLRDLKREAAIDIRGDVE